MHACLHPDIHTVLGPLSLSPVWSHTVAGSPALKLLLYQRLGAASTVRYALQTENLAEWFISGKGCQESLRSNETERIRAWVEEGAKSGAFWKHTQNWVRITSQSHDAKSGGGWSPCGRMLVNSGALGETNSHVEMKTGSSRILQYGCRVRWTIWWFFLSSFFPSLSFLGKWGVGLVVDLASRGLKWFDE